MRSRFMISLGLLLLRGAAVLGQEAARECRPNPKINVAHGDGHGADVASEFRSGCDINSALNTGLTTPRCSEVRLHAPRNLRGDHLHLTSGDDFQVYFWD